MYHAYNVFVFHNVHKITTIIDLLFCPLVLNNNGCKCELSGFEPGFAPTASQSRVGMKIGLQFSFHWSAPQTGGFCVGARLVRQVYKDLTHRVHVPVEL